MQGLAKSEPGALRERVDESCRGQNFAAVADTTAPHGGYNAKLAAGDGHRGKGVFAGYLMNTELGSPRARTLPNPPQKVSLPVSSQEARGSGQWFGAAGNGRAKPCFSPPACCWVRLHCL